MNDVYRIRGGKKLRGTVAVSGSKNAALPILAASLAINGTSKIKNLPDISDVHKFCSMIEFLGGKLIRNGGDITINTESLTFSPPYFDHPAIGKMRASILLLAPMLKRFGEIKMKFPGGCVLGKRSAEAHLKAFISMGVQILDSTDHLHLRLPNKKFIPSKIVLPEISVTATENAIIAAACADGQTEIRMAAAEPHVQNLCQFLKTTGVKIEGIGTHFLRITGNPAATEATGKIVPDYLEAGTFILAGILTDSSITVQNVVSDHLDSFFEKLAETGARFEIDEIKQQVRTISPQPVFRATDIQTGVFPKFPTDLHPQFGVLLTQCAGTSKIFETLFERKFAYLLELEKLGANVKILNPHEFIIEGPKLLEGADVASQDIRAGAAVILATLTANGESIVSNIHYLDRGYENFDQKLQKLGADISREVR